jgi:2-polyprenyl-3-methyl-5-hydroxy-6-metoxy-1,4-benzoquinol methylase
MPTTKDHYDMLLAQHYSWMVGDAAPASQLLAGLLQQYVLPANGPKVAIDLGAGTGIHSLLLAQMGYAVTAIDFCHALLQEWQEYTRTLPITPICDNLLQFRQHCHHPANVIVCAGDTIAHLPDWEHMGTLLADVWTALADGGVLYLSFRDHSGVPDGTTRIVPVQSNREKILTCILQYGHTHITVTDVLHQWQQEKWTLNTGSYLKLKITTDKLLPYLQQYKLRLLHCKAENGLVHLMAQK